MVDVAISLGPLLFIGRCSSEHRLEKSRAGAILTYETSLEHRNDPLIGLSHIYLGPESKLCDFTGMRELLELLKSSPNC